MRQLPAVLLLGCALAHAQPAAPEPTRVQLNGMLGSRAALLIIDGEPRTVAVGATAKGVKLLALEDGRATVEFGGRRHMLDLGAAPGRLLPQASTGRQIVLPVGQGGHFTSLGTVNGRVANFMVDTGATSVALGQAEAERMGLRFLEGRRLTTMTANGAVSAYQLRLASVRIGDVEVRDVEAVVVPGSMPYVLLGNSFLNRFQMRRENDVMTLELRY